MKIISYNGARAVHMHAMYCE